ncbi:MAG TPA: hypothetical protein VKQ71_02780, partial [Acidimicrobiales bacterium]|nr:hypothetical protein [Acidimicrobiales bacterium]
EPAARAPWAWWRSLLVSAEYTLRDRANFFRGVASRRLGWLQLLEVDLFEQVPEMLVPVFFIEARHDWEVPRSCQRAISSRFESRRSDSSGSRTCHPCPTPRSETASTRSSGRRGVVALATA